MIRLLVVLTLALLIVPAIGRDLDGRWAQSPLRDWMRSLKDKMGVACCDDADGEDVDGWDIRDGSYWVRVKGQWLIVPPRAMLDVPNRLGYPRVWIYYEQGQPKVRCFLAGAGG